MRREFSRSQSQGTGKFLRFLAETFIEARAIDLLNQILRKGFLRFLAETFIEANEQLGSGKSSRLGFLRFLAETFIEARVLPEPDPEPGHFFAF